MRCEHDECMADGVPIRYYSRDGSTKTTYFCRQHIPLTDEEKVELAMLEAEFFECHRYVEENLRDALLPYLTKSNNAP